MASSWSIVNIRLKNCILKIQKKKGKATFNYFDGKSENVFLKGPDSVLG